MAVVDRVAGRGVTDINIHEHRYTHKQKYIHEHTYIKTDTYVNIDTVHKHSVYQRWGLELETWSRVVVNLLTQ